jgi:sugar phosphate permease
MVAFWYRRQGTFWIMALPIAGLGAALTYILDTDRQFIEWRHHWIWDLLFAAIYAMVLDRWIKEALLDDAFPCDEADELRRSTVAVRFLAFALVLCACIELNIVLAASAAALIALLLLSFVAYGLASTFRQVTHWQPPARSGRR